MLGKRIITSSFPLQTHGTWVQIEIHQTSYIPSMFQIWECSSPASQVQRTLGFILATPRHQNRWQPEQLKTFSTFCFADFLWVFFTWAKIKQFLYKFQVIFHCPRLNTANLVPAVLFPASSMGWCLSRESWGAIFVKWWCYTCNKFQVIQAVTFFIPNLEVT